MTAGAFERPRHPSVFLLQRKDGEYVEILDLFKPLLAAAPLGETPNCKGGRCAWLDEERGRYAVLSAAYSLGYVEG